MQFSGLSRELPQFLVELKANNKREWFEANKPRFQTVCVGPSLALIDALEPYAAGLNPPHRAEARINGSLRRIYRDTRFSKDKTPYHTHLHIILWTGDHPNRSPGIHLIFGADGFGIGAGHWAFSNEELARFRAALSGAKAVETLQQALDRAAADGQTPDAPELKRIPPGFQGEGLAGEMLRRKGLVVRTRAPEPYDEALFGDGAADWLQRRMDASVPVQNWLAANVYGRA